GGASLMEDYTYDLTPGDERILGAHMLEVSPTLTAEQPTLEVHPLGIGGKDDPVRLVFTADPGEAVVVALSDTRDGFRLTANTVDVVPPTEALPLLPVGRAVWTPRPSFPVAAECWLTAGAAHHTVMTTAVGPRVVEDLATMAGTEYLSIDEHTTLAGFRDELRLQQVWHRLDRGF
ncbi:MAG: L-arabinose isomerase, partial [Williamsia herbipolensis]|nr:L-arabinose isomerase [Williamsia herbipolensis]